MIEKSLTGLLNAHIPDAVVRKQVQQTTTYYQKCNRLEQRPMTPDAIIRFLRTAVGGQNPTMTKGGIDAIVLEIVDRSMRSHDGTRVVATSPTSRDYTRMARKQKLANLKKYR